MIFLHRGVDGEEIAIAWTDREPLRLIALCADDEELEIAFPGHQIEGLGPKGWQGGGTYFWAVELHPSQLVQRFARWLEECCPEPGDPDREPLTPAGIQAILDEVQD